MKANRVQMSNAGVYVIINKISWKFYIGSSSDIKERFRAHRGMLKNNMHSNHIQADWYIYGENDFIFIKVNDCKDVNEARLLEQWWLLFFKWNGFRLYKELYNETWKVGGGKRWKIHPMLGKHCSEESKKRKSDTLNKPNIKEKHRVATIAGLNKPGIKEKHKTAIKLALNKPDIRKKMSEAHLGKKNSMSGKTVYSVWLKKYGKEEADRLLIETNKKKSKAHSGERNISAKLNWKIVNTIRIEFSLWAETKGKFYIEQSQKYSVSIVTIKRIVYNKTWKKLLEENENNLQQLQQVHSNDDNKSK